MADSIRYKINVEPREELTDEQGNTKNVISGEVGKRLGGSGIAVVTDYSGSVATQGYKDGAVNYFECNDAANNVFANEASASLVFIKNTGHKYSSATVLGSELDRSIKVSYDDTGLGVGTLTILDAGEPLVLKDDNAGIKASEIYVKTVDTDGSNNVTGNYLAVEFLVVD